MNRLLRALALSVVSALAPLAAEAVAAGTAPRLARQVEGPSDGSGAELTIEGDPSTEACGCGNRQQPPWHGNVHGDPCTTACGRPCGGVFHADPCHQLHLRGYARAHCMTMPPCFPRLHGWWAEGHMPTPRPPSLPRCHQCGAVIDGGF